MKENFFKNKLNEDRKDGRKLWNHIKKLLPNNSTTKINSLKDNDMNLHTDNKSMSNISNTFFSTIGSKLADKFPRVETHQIQVNINNNSFSFSNVSEDIILKIINSLDNNKSSGLDGISVRALKAGSSVLSKKLSIIMNHSLAIGKVPKLWKVKKVIPLFKEGDTEDCNNYRPISILPVPMKIFEKIVNLQISEFIEKNNILNKHQSGFRGLHSTDTAVLEVSDFILDELSKGRIVGAVLIDFKKAFDTVDHTILLKKLFCYGFRDASFEWISSYLSDRSQCSLVNGQISDTCSEEAYGVPQGSVLGPLFSSLTKRSYLFLARGFTISWWVFGSDYPAFYPSQTFPFAVR